MRNGHSTPGCIWRLKDTARCGARLDSSAIENSTIVPWTRQAGPQPVQSNELSSPEHPFHVKHLDWHLAAPLFVGTAPARTCKQCIVRAGDTSEAVHTPTRPRRGGWNQVRLRPAYGTVGLDYCGAQTSRSTDWRFPEPLPGNSKNLIWPGHGSMTYKSRVLPATCVGGQLSTELEMTPSTYRRRTLGR